MELATFIGWGMNRIIGNSSNRAAAKYGLMSSGKDCGLWLKLFSRESIEIGNSKK